MEINGVNRSVHTTPLTVAEVPQDLAAENRDVVQAVKALNATEMFGQDNQLLFQRDPQSHRMVIRLVDQKTKEVITQIPPEYVLRLAEDLRPKNQAG